MAAMMMSNLLPTVFSRFFEASVADERRLRALTVAQLRQVISAAGLSDHDCIDKDDLVARACEAERAMARQATREQAAAAAARRSWDAAARTGFIRKVYGIVACQVLLTIAMVALACWSHQFALYCAYAQEYTWYISLAVLVGLRYRKNSYPQNYLLLLALTVTTGTTVAASSALYFYTGNGAAVWSASALTAIGFLSLSVYAHLSSTDFSCLGCGLFCGLSMLCALYVCQWLGALATQIWTAYAGVALFCGYVVYDTDRISRRDGMPLDDFVVGAVELYLDIVNLFLHLLRIFGSGEKKRQGDKSR
jgi:FtsH-binding integral membrane protein